MGFVSTFWSLIALAIRRLRSDPWLTLSVLLGLTTAVTLTTSVPMYVEAANNRVLRQELGEIEARGTPAFAFMYRYAYQGGDGLKDAEFVSLDQYISQSAAHTIALPTQMAGMTLQSDYFDIFASSQFYETTRHALGRFKVGYVRGLAEHIQIHQGSFPAVNKGSLSDPVEVLLSEKKAGEIGAQPGEEFILFRNDGKERVQFTVRIAGIWTPTVVEERYWFLSPTVYDDILLMPEESYTRFVVPTVKVSPMYYNYAAWYQVYDGRDFTADAAAGLLRRMAAMQSKIRGIAPDLSFPVSPEEALNRHATEVQLETKLLLTFGLPVIALALFFAAFIAAMSVSRRNSEIAMFLSRGVSLSQMVILYLVQCVLLGAAALGLGLLAGRYVAQLLGDTHAFLSFVARGPMRVLVTATSVRIGILTTVLAIPFFLIPALRASRGTVVTAARLAGRPMVRRILEGGLLDLSLLAVAVYGYWIIKNGQALSYLIGGAGDPLQQPLVLVTPALFLLVGTLLFLRLAPYFFGALATLTSAFGGTVSLLALRHLSRAASYYSGVLLLLTLSIGLSLFTSSMAWTLDKNLVERAYYEVGADLRLEEEGVSTAGLGGAVTSGALSTGTSTSNVATVDQASAADQALLFSSIPIDEALKVPGIKGATRVNRVEVTLRSGSDTQPGTLLGVERARIPGIAFFRHDFAIRSLGSLMNGLATNYDGIVVDRQILREFGLNIGDPINLSLNNAEMTRMSFHIVGTIDLFPTVYQKDFPVFICNLDYLIEQLGWPMPANIWLSVDPAASSETVLKDLGAAGFRIRSATDAREMIAKEQNQLLRVGIFGFLSVGFVAATILSVLSLTIYAFMSLQQRFIQFGILQAIGLSRGQLERVFVLEQILIVFLGLLAGSGLGLYVSNLFLPFFQVSVKASTPLPPLLVEIAWSDMWKTYAILGGALFMLAIAVFIVLRNLRLFEAVKLGTRLTG